MAWYWWLLIVFVFSIWSLGGYMALRHGGGSKIGDSVLYLGHEATIVGFRHDGTLIDFIEHGHHNRVLVPSGEANRLLREPHVRRKPREKYDADVEQRSAEFYDHEQETTGPFPESPAGVINLVQEFVVAASPPFRRVILPRPRTVDDEENGAGRDERCAPPSVISERLVDVGRDNESVHDKGCRGEPEVFFQDIGLGHESLEASNVGVSGGVGRNREDARSGDQTQPNQDGPSGR
jgi:hypothetical protein